MTIHGVVLLSIKDNCGTLDTHNGFEWLLSSDDITHACMLTDDQLSRSGHVQSLGDMDQLWHSPNLSRLPLSSWIVDLFLNSHFQHMLQDHFGFAAEETSGTANRPGSFPLCSPHILYREANPINAVHHMTTLILVLRVTWLGLHQGHIRNTLTVMATSQIYHLTAV